MASSSVEEVELGFAEDAEDYSKLTSAYFPSKIGGKPAWLDPRLPIPEDLVCKKCNKPRVFLLQLYAPIDHMIHCYHRTLYIFCCREPLCHSRSCAEPFLVLRCTLPQFGPQSNSSKIVGVPGDGGVINSKDGNNSTNSIENNGCLTDAHDDSVSEAITDTLHSAGDAAFSNCGDKDQQQKGLESNLSLLPPLCIVCGCSGPKRCFKCHSLNYCSREHQVIHWKAGHKKHCGDEKQPITSDEAGGILFKEFEIVTEPELPIKITPEKSEEERLKDYHKFLEQHSGKFDSAEMDKMCLDEVGKGVKKDKQFMTFKKRIAVEPDQVIRYQRGGAPLWISSENLPNQIPVCERCGSKRVFEFQVMPQLLYYLKLDSTEGASIDWGTLAVYSCEKSCTSGSTGAAYQPEFLWKQDPKSDTSSPVAWCSCHVGIMVKWDNYAIAPLVKLTINTSFDQNGKHLTLRLTLC